MPEHDWVGDHCPGDDEGRQITDAIDADPAEAARLARSRREAAEGLASALRTAAENLATADGGHVTETRPHGPGFAHGGSGPVGASEETGGAVQAVSGPPEDAGIDDETAGWALRAIAEAQAERDRARQIALALECEVAALTDALGHPALTHEFTPHPDGAGWCMAEPPRWHQEICGLKQDHPAHRTPARVRAELEGQA